MAAGPRKLRVLCLHGYAQTGQQLRQKTGSLRSEAKKIASWTFAEAPHTAREEHGGGRSWWRFEEGSSVEGEKHTYDAAKIDQSIQSIASVFAEQGPVVQVKTQTSERALLAACSLSNDAFRTPPRVAPHGPELHPGITPQGLHLRLD